MSYTYSHLEYSFIIYQIHKGFCCTDEEIEILRAFDQSHTTSERQSLDVNWVRLHILYLKRIYMLPCPREGSSRPFTMPFYQQLCCCWLRPFLYTLVGYKSLVVRSKWSYGPKVPRLALWTVSSYQIITDLVEYQGDSEDNPFHAPPRSEWLKLV